MKVEQAMDLARRFHDGAVDKAGNPYIGHVQRVVDAVDSHDEKLAAAMHDLLEDTPLTRQHLICAGCPSDIATAVEALTRTPGEDYETFCRRAAANPVARVVKLADIADNADEGRLAVLEPELADRLRSKYEHARSVILQEHEPALDEQTRHEDDFAKIGIPQGVGESWCTYWCAECGLPAGTLTLVRAEIGIFHPEVGYCLELSTFVGSKSHSLSDEDVDTVRIQLEQGDAGPFLNLDKELAPFWCPRCQKSYCGAHWFQDVRFDDGFFDEIVGTCPHGHRRQLWD